MENSRTDSAPKKRQKIYPPLQVGKWYARPSSNGVGTSMYKLANVEDRAGVGTVYVFNVLFILRNGKLERSYFGFKNGKYELSFIDLMRVDFFEVFPEEIELLNAAK